MLAIYGYGMKVSDLTWIQNFIDEPVCLFGNPIVGLASCLRWVTEVNGDDVDVTQFECLMVRLVHL